MRAPTKTLFRRGPRPLGQDADPIADEQPELTPLAHRLRLLRTAHAAGLLTDRELSERRLALLERRLRSAASPHGERRRAPA